MEKKIDDLYAVADAENRATEQANKKEAADRAVYEAQVVPLVESLITAIAAKAEEFNAHPNTKNKAAVMPARTQIKIRRPSDIRIPDRRIEVNFRRDLAEISWTYEVSPNPIYVKYEIPAWGTAHFEVIGGKLRVKGAATSPQAFADWVLGAFIEDCVHDTVS